MSLGQRFGFCRCPLLNAHKYHWVSLYCCLSAKCLQLPDESWPADQPLLMLTLTITWWALVNWSASVVVLCCTLTNTWWALASWSASVSVLCCTLTNTWWALASWSASVGVFCCTLTNTWWALASWSASVGILDVRCCGRSQVPDEPWLADQPLLVSSAVRSQIPLMVTGQISVVVLCCTLTITWSPLASWSSSLDVLSCTLTNTLAGQPLLLSAAGRSQVPDEPWPADQPLLVFSAERSQLSPHVSLAPGRQVLYKFGEKNFYIYR